MECGEPEASHAERIAEYDGDVTGGTGDYSAMASHGRVRADAGGWVSGPCLPPGATPHGELCAAVIAALDVPPPATVADEVTYLRLARDRALLVLDALRAATAPGAGGLDVLFAAACLCDQLADYPDDTYDHASTS